MILQQGDVLIIQESSLPDDCKKINRSAKGYILAEGEVTGHAHVIEEEIKFYKDKQGRLFFKAEKTVTVKHEEHKAISVSPGIYRIDIVQEYDHFAEEARKVVD